MRGMLLRMGLGLAVGVALTAVAWVWVSVRVGRATGTAPVFPVWVLVFAGVVFLVMGLGTALLRPWRQHREDGTERRGARVASAFLPLAFFGTFMAVQAGAGGGSVLAGMLSQAPMLLMFAGMGVAGLAVRRVGREARCSKCEYEMDAEVEREGDPDSRCPECGHYWKRPHGMVRGRKHRSKRAIAGAAVLVMLCFALMPVQFMMRGTVPNLLPTSSLIREVTSAPRGFTMDEWAALSTRTLSESQKLELAEGLLRLRERKQYLAREAEAWMETAALAGELPAAMAERYFAGMLEVFFDAPEEARMGELISVGLGSDHRGSLGTPLSTKLKVFAVFAGFEVGDGPLQGAAERPFYGLSFGRVRRAWGRIEATGDPGPEISVAPDQPGPLRISAEYWLVVAPDPPPSPVKWSAAGEPVVAPGTVWLERREIQRTINVLPAADGAR